ncbi:MAG: hypothetical protein QOD53_439 [Thermoleophilaceae bacterium]|jgi:hypothetical protein|nr:hypothetical protein [Thermoleophilaceae bacterium]
MNGKSPAQLYALIIGATLVIAGIIGFFYSSSFGSPGRTDDVFGILSVNGWHNVVHIASGALGLLALSYAASRKYALGLALVYTVVTVWGVIIGNGESILGLVPVNTEDTVLHAIIALAGFAAYAATPAVQAVTTRESRAATA